MKAMQKTRHPIIRYRCPTAHGSPGPGDIVMGPGTRTRRAYRVRDVRKGHSSLPGLGVSTWRLCVEPMSAAHGREEIAAGCPSWSLKWDARVSANV